MQTPKSKAEKNGLNPTTGEAASDFQAHQRRDLNPHLRPNKKDQRNYSCTFVLLKREHKVEQQSTAFEAKPRKKVDYSWGTILGL